MSLNVNSKIEGTLFNIPEKDRRPNGPVMKGDFQITGEAGKIQGSAWLKQKEEDGSTYLSFQLEISRELKYYGAIFPTTDKTADKAPDYFGTFNLAKEKGSPTLRIAGWKRKGKNEPFTPFISVVIEPPRPKSGTEAPAQQQRRQPANELPI